MARHQLTNEQRAAALERAIASRRARAEVRDRLKRGGTSLTQVLIDAESDEVLAKMRVSALLEALPKVGKITARQIMAELKIARTRRLRGLGDRQRRALLQKFDRADGQQHDHLNAGQDQPRSTTQAGSDELRCRRGLAAS